MPPVTRTYRDFNLSFVPHPVTGDIATLTDADAVKTAVKNLVLTDNYERLEQPKLGSPVAHMLFEPMTSITQYRLRTSIEDLIRAYEPRALLVRVDVALNYTMDGYNVHVIMAVKNLSDPVDIKFFLKRLR